MVTPTYPTRRIVIDTREQLPWNFAPNRTVRAALGQGDYSLEGLQHFVAIERKSINDLVGSLTAGRDRFKRELLRMRSLVAHPWILVECTLDDIAERRYRSKAAPSSVVGSMVSFAMKYKIQLLFASSRQLAMAASLRILCCAERLYEEDGAGSARPEEVRANTGEGVSPADN